MDVVYLVNKDHEYVQGVQEIFGIVTYTRDFREARKFYREHANEIIQRVSSVTNGHVKLRTTV